MAGKRKKGEGTVRLRKDGRWEGRVVVSYDASGNPKTKNVLAKTKKECVAKLEKLKGECGSVRSTQVRPDMLFRDWLNEWYQNDAKPRLRPTTQLQYEGFLQHHLIPGLGEIPLNQLTQGELQQFFRHMKESGRKVQVERYLWHWTEGKTIYETGKVSSELSDAVSKDLKRRGMKFVGTVIIYSYLQAVGVIQLP